MPTPPQPLAIDAARLLAELHHLATLTDCPPADPALPAPAQAVTRIVFTPRDLEARAYILSLAHAAGFDTRVDPVGNTYLRWPGSDPGLGVVATGSHTDAIPHAGMYDGTVGVLGGLEAMRALKNSGFLPKRTLETLMFTSEEPTRFGIGCLGSRLLGGVLSPAAADALPDLISETEAGAPPSPTASSSAKVGPQTLHDVRIAAGFTGPLTAVPLPPGYFHAWVELHIEQGPLLEREMLSRADENQVAQSFSLGSPSPSQEEGVLTPPGPADARVAPSFSLGSHSPSQEEGVLTPPGPADARVAPSFSLGSHSPSQEEGVLTPEAPVLGIVTHIAAPASYRFTLEGHGGHAGALLMPDRRDALCAAAEIILSVERHTLAANKRSNGVDSVATVGAVQVHPGAVNSVPSRVTLMLDIRDTDPERRDRTMAALRADIAEIQSRRNVRIAEECINADEPATSDPHIVATLAALCEQERVPCGRMVSRAYHDTSFIARIAPVAMLFIPCRDGVSHRPDEYATPDAIALGTRILAQALAHLANE